MNKAKPIMAPRQTSICWGAISHFLLVKEHVRPVRTVRLFVKPCIMRVPQKIDSLDGQCHCGE